MKRILILLPFSSFVVVFFLCTVSHSTEIEIIYASRLREIQPLKDNVGGVAELATLVKEVRANNANTLFLHGGDFLAPSVLSSFDKGSHMIDILNLIEPDAMSISEREFAFKEDNLIIRVSEADFPFVSSNSTDSLTDKPLQGIEQDLCYTFGEHKVCVISALDPKVVNSYQVNRLKVVEGSRWISAMVTSLKKQGADFIVLFTAHEIPEIANLMEAEGIDVVLHTDSNEYSEKRNSGGLYVKQSSGQGKATKISVDLEGHGDSAKKKVSSESVVLKNFPKDKEVEQRIQYYEEHFSSVLKVFVCTTLTPVEVSRAQVRTAENSYGNLAADALRDRLGTDIAFINAGSIRAEIRYPAGYQFTRKDIQSLMPFGNKAVKISLMGSDLYDVFENSICFIEEVRGRFLQVSGIEVEYCPRMKAGHRVVSLKVGGQPIDENKVYTIATDEYVANGGDGYTVLKDRGIIHEVREYLSVWEIVRLYAEKKKVIAPKIEGRIVFHCAPTLPLEM